MSYPFLAMSTNFASLNLWKTEETFDEETLDLNFPNNVSSVSLDPECWCLSSLDEALLPSFSSATCSAEASEGPEACSFPIPKDSLT